MENQTEKPQRLFDFLYHQKEYFPKEDMFATKINGKWEKFSTEKVTDSTIRLSAGLLKLGLGKKEMNPELQDKVAVISKNRPEWLILDLACQQIGVLLCPIYPTTTKSEVEFILNDASVKLLFFSGEDLIDKLSEIKQSVPSLEEIFCFDNLQGYRNWNAIAENISETEINEVHSIKKNILPEHCATIIYTSGTTGFPKGVMLSHKNIVSNVINSVSSFPFPKMINARSLSFLPLNHIFERMASYIYMYSGISIYYAESMETIGDNLKDVKPVLFTTVPRLLEKTYEKILQKGAELKGIKKKLFYWSLSLAEKYDNLKDGGLWYNIQLSLANKIVFKKWRAALGGNIQFIITGGAACQLKLLRIFNAAKIAVYEGYGPTENSPVISVNCQKKGGTKFGTVGLVIEDQEVKIQEDGEICVKGPSVMMGYYKRPDLTNEAIINGWLHTGDIGVFEDGKYLKITDRKKELFKTSGGKYVAPQVIENKLKESQFIEQIMVIGADKKFVAALIVPSFPQLINWMRENNISISTPEEIVSQPAVYAHYEKIINKFNISFNQVEQIKKFKLISKEWGVESGELTPKLSMKRKVIMEKHSLHISKMYE